ncbi:MAG: hypothetical protein RLZZ602_755 [Pseudomonadota bacterium]
MALPFMGRRSVVFLAVAAAYICLVDRLAISIAIIPMVEAYDWSPTDQGAVMSAFFVGYVVLQLPAGWLSDRVGGKWVLGVGVLLWSLFTMLTPPAATAGIAILIICRFFMGVFESVTWPAVYTLFACWVPLSQRGFSLGLLNSAIAGGTVIAMLATPWLIEQWSWQVAFYVYGVLGLLWSAVWFPLIPNRTQPAATEVLPVRDAAAEDLQLAPSGSTMADCEGVDGASLSSTVSAFTPRNVLASSGVRALFFAHFCTNWVVYLSLAWSPTYLTQVWGVTLAEVGFLAVVPFLISVVATPIVGKWADHLIARGYDRLRIRKFMQTVALVGVAVAFVMIDFARSVEEVILVLCFGNLLVSASIAGFGSNPIDLAPSYAGTLYGASNTLASVGSAGAVFVAGLVLDLTGSWAMVFDSAALLSVIGAAVFWRWASVQQEF